MKPRITEGDPARNAPIVMPAVLIMILSVVIFSGILLADPVEVADDQVAVTAPAETEKTPVDATAELEAIQKQNNKCLRCHSRDKVKTLEDGQSLSLQIHAEEYGDSAHADVACVSCHEAIGNRKHPSASTNITISNQRDYSLEMNQSCRNCHDKKFTQYEGSIHAAMIAQGSTRAPICTDCHSAHAIQSMAKFEAETGLPCRKCHENIYNAYSESVHGSARAQGNVIRDDHIQAPICSDCHSSHEVTAVEIGDTLRTQCFGCHENVPLLHSQWLPNAGNHLDIVSCAVCHSPFAKHRFDLHFFDNVAKVPVGQKEAYDLFQQQLKELEEEGGVVDPLAVWKLMEQSNRNTPSNITLRGRMEVRSGVWAHQIAPKSFAVRTCDSCHQEGKRQALNVTVSVPQQDGRLQRFETDRADLSSVGAANSMSDFLSLGGNRNKLLDIMVLLSFISGIAIPIGHFTLGKMIKEKIEKGELQ